MPLSMEGVQREIGLTPEQKQQLKAVSDGYVASMQQLGKSFRELSPEEQQKRAKDISDQAAQFARNAQRKAEAILTPQQLQVVEKIAFQLSAAGALSDPGLAREARPQPGATSAADRGLRAGGREDAAASARHGHAGHAVARRGASR